MDFQRQRPDLFHFLSFHFRLPRSIWSFQARDQILAAAATYAAARTDPLTHCAELASEPVSLSCRDTSNPIAPKREFLDFLLNGASFWPLLVT